jgi:hypothetical protein
MDVNVYNDNTDYRGYLQDDALSQMMDQLLKILCPTLRIWEPFYFVSGKARAYVKTCPTKKDRATIGILFANLFFITFLFGWSIVMVITRMNVIPLLVLIGYTLLCVALVYSDLTG